MTQFPRQVVKLVSIYHLPTTSGQKQPYPGTADVTAYGAFLPMDRYSHGLEGGDYTDPFELYLETSVDVRVGDKIVIDSTTYFARKVFNGYFGGHKHKRVSISTQA